MKGRRRDMGVARRRLVLCYPPIRTGSVALAGAGCASVPQPSASSTRRTATTYCSASVLARSLGIGRSASFMAHVSAPLRRPQAAASVERAGAAKAQGGACCAARGAGRHPETQSRGFRERRPMMHVIGWIGSAPASYSPSLSCWSPPLSGKAGRVRPTERQPSASWVLVAGGLATLSGLLLWALL